MCVRPTFCVPPQKIEGGTKVGINIVCVFVPPLQFWGVPSNGIKRVGAVPTPGLEQGFDWSCLASLYGGFRGGPFLQTLSSWFLFLGTFRLQTLLLVLKLLCGRVQERGPAWWPEITPGRVDPPSSCQLGGQIVTSLVQATLPRRWRREWQLNRPCLIGGELAEERQDTDCVGR